MANILQYPTDQPAAREEGFVHFLAREGRGALRWTIGVCIVAIVICMVSPGFYFVAVAPAIVLLAAYALLVMTNVIERTSDRQAHRVLEQTETAVVDDVIEDHAEDNQLPAKDIEIVKRESRTGLYVLVAAMLTALLLAAILFDFQVLAIGAMVVFAYMLLISAPLWLGWFNDDIEIASHRLEGEPPPPQARD